MPVWEMMANSGVGQNPPNYPNIIKKYVSTKSPRNMHNTSSYTNLGVTNPFLRYFGWLRVKKCPKQRWPPLPLIKLCFHQNIVQRYKIHELWLISSRGIHFWRLFCDPVSLCVRNPRWPPWAEPVVAAIFVSHTCWPEIAKQTSEMDSSPLN